MTATKRKTAHQRGYGVVHQKRREALLRSHRDGTPCTWCGRPMYKDPAKNWDHEPLHADHSTAISKTRGQADRLMCATCNKQRGNGDWDDQSPLKTGIPPEQWSKTTLGKPPQGQATTRRTHFQHIAIEFV